MKERAISAIADEFKKEAVVPFWMWNDRLERDSLLKQLQEIKERGMNQVIIHPRLGLETPYLSEEWFEMVGFVVRAAEKSNMGLWIYDELNWPSGYAGGEVLRRNPELCAKHLVQTGNGFETRNTSWKPAYSSDRYIDVLNPEAVNSFIEIVHEQYWHRFGDFFGSAILGFFTDEPGMYNNFAGLDPGSIPWTDKLPAFFESRNGSSLESSLPLVFEGKEKESVEARVAYWDTISHLYQKSYFKKLQKWCHHKGVAFVGHVLVEEDLVDTAKTQGSFFTTMECLDFAGYDLLGRLEPRTLIAAKLADSARKVFDLHGVTAETFGMFGWDLTKDEMLRVAKWQAEQGLDVLIPHALYYSLRGKRQGDCPPSFMSRKYWADFDKFVGYFREQQETLEEQSTEVAIYYPIETIWGYLSPSETTEAEEVDYAFKTASYACYNIGSTFDYVPGHFINDDGLEGYSCLILPKTEVLSLEVLRKIVEFSKNGGSVICIGGEPKFANKAVNCAELERIWQELRSSVNFISLPDRNIKQASFDQSKKSFKKVLSQKVPPIWLARGVHLAKLLGYKRPIKVNQITGIEEQLESFLKQS